MSISNSVKKYLAKSGLPYKLVEHPRTQSLQEAGKLSSIPARNILRAVMLKDGIGEVMAVLPTTHILDFTLIYQTLGRDLSPTYRHGIESEIPGCEPGSHPPLPHLAGVEAMMDESIGEAGTICFEGGSHDVLICMRSKDFLQIAGKSWAGSFSRPLETLEDLEENSIAGMADRFTPAKLKEGVQGIRDIPPLPESAKAIEKLRNYSEATTQDLIDLVKSDPSLAAQVMHWARSPMYGGDHTVTSIREAIESVMGYDMVLNLMSGLSIGRNFRLPPDGPMGLNAFWRHSVFCAALAERLAMRMESETRPDAGLTYLSGLLHNFGFLLLAPMFPAQYFLLNRFISMNAHIPMRKIEQYVVGVAHTNIGAWLMESWKLPEELVTAVRWHHEEDYSGDHAEYANLVLLANRLLKSKGLGDETDSYLPETLLNSLGLNEADALEALEAVWEEQSNLNALSRAIAA